MKNLVFTIGEKLVKFKVSEFQDDLDLDCLLKIDYGNLVAELITSPLVVNKMGILSAEMSNQLRLAKMNFEIRKAKIQQQVRENLSEDDEKGKVRKPTVAEVEDALLMNKLFQKYQKDYFEVQKQKDYIDSIYNSIKDKSEKLNKLSLTLRSGDIDEELIQKQLNNVYYQIKDNK